MDSNEKSLPHIAKFILPAIFLIFIFGMVIAMLVSEDRDFSQTENRYLTQKPEFSWESLKSGDFTSDLESYLADQIFLKDALVTLKTDCDRLMGKTLQNGVYFGDDGYYLQQYTENKAQLDKNVSCLNDFADIVDVPVDFLLVPNAVSELAEKLPACAVNDLQSESIDYVYENLTDKITVCDLRSVLKNENYYYRTDHHWTSEGAKAAAEAYFATTGQQLQSVNYEIKNVEGFYGTLYSKAPSALAKSDTMHIYTNSDGQYSVEYVSESKITDSIYERSCLDTKDKYSVFFGGNFSQIKITSNNDGEKVLILKDSYANSIVPFLADQYSEITMIDLRYYHMEENTVSELCEKYDVNRVILIYNLDFFNSDNNFIWLD